MKPDYFSIILTSSLVAALVSAISAWFNEWRRRVSEEKRFKLEAALDLLLADLSAQQSIRQLVENFQQRYTQLHVLINNAGLFMLRRRTTVDGLEMTFAVDYLAPFLLTNLLLDVLKASAPARIVNASSNSHEAGYIKLDDLQAEHHYRSMRAYGRSEERRVGKECRSRWSPYH